MLQLQIDLITTAVTNWSGAQIQALTRKWPGAFPLEIRYVRGATTPREQLAENATVSAILKHATTGVVLATPPAATRINSGAAAYYTIPLTLSTAAINPLFAADTPVIDTIPAVLEIRYIQPGYDDRSVSLPMIIQRGLSTDDDLDVEPVVPYPSSAVVNGHIASTSNPHSTTASHLTSGTLPDARLSANVMTLTGAQTVTGLKRFGASIEFDGATVDAFRTALAVTDPTAARTITLPNATGTVALLNQPQIFTQPQTVRTPAGASLIDREAVGATGAVWGALSLRLTATGDISDGGGPIMRFEIDDDAVAGATGIGNVGFVRSGADDSGAFVVQPFSAGVATTRLRVAPGGKTTIHTLNLSNLPTASAGLVSGDVWSDSGVLKIIS